MTLRNIAIALGVAMASAAIISCNSSTTESEELVLPSSAGVKTFSLAANSSVCANLDSVFFSIDLITAQIFNADSLPYGTRVTALVPKVTTIEDASVTEFKVTRANGTDTTYNYLTNSSDSIDFTNPVTLRIVSANGAVDRSYTVRVNVHKMKPDSLAWSQDAVRSLPTDFAAPTAQRTVRANDTFYTLTTDGSAYTIASHSGDLAGLNGAVMNFADWTKSTVDFPFTPQVETFAATPAALYILADDGALWTSADGGRNWTATPEKWHAIYGAYGDELLGSANDANNWTIRSYPQQRSWNLPAGMPVEATSVPVSYDFAMSDDAQMVLLGGRCANGALSADCWGFDGNSWVKISTTGLPEGLEGVAVAQYFTFKTSSGWNVTTMPTMIAFGGRKASGELSAVVYISNDYGFNWLKAGELLQLPDYMQPFCGAQAYVMSSLYSANIAAAPKRIVKPIESWECPFIYLFGGINAQGTLNNTVWRGAINRLTFKPIE